MTVSVYAHDSADDRPDESRWLPGELGSPRELVAQPGLHIQLHRAHVYPNGVLVTLTVRAGHLSGRQAQQSFAADVLSYHVREHAGPRLAQKMPSGSGGRYAEPWGQGGSGGVYVLPYWLPATPGRDPLLLRFTWPSRDIACEIEYSVHDCADALSRARQVII